MGRGETAGQHVLYVAHELPTFSDFVTRHNRHLVEMGECRIDEAACVPTQTLGTTPALPLCFVPEWRSVIKLQH